MVSKGTETGQQFPPNHKGPPQFAASRVINVIFYLQRGLGYKVLGEGLGQEGHRYSVSGALTINSHHPNHKESFKKKTTNSNQYADSHTLPQITRVSIFGSRARNPSSLSDSDELDAGPALHDMPQRGSFGILALLDVPGRTVLWLLQ